MAIVERSRVNVWIFLSARTRKSDSCREVAVSGVSTVLEEITKYDHP